MTTLRSRTQPDGLARGTLSTGVGLAARALLQAAIFVTISRTLGVESYGTFAAIFALASIFGGLAALGSQIVMLRDVSRSRDVFPAAWSNTLLTIGVSAPALFVAYALLANWSLPDEVSPLAVLLVGLAEILFTPLSLAAVTAYQAHDRMGRAARLTLLPVLPRFVAAVALWFLAQRMSPDSLFLTWVTLYTAAALVAAAYAQCLAFRDLGLGQRPAATAICLAIRRGFPFVAAATATRIHNEIDKPMLSRLSTLEQTGAYSAAYRVMDLVAIPISSVLTATWPRFFRAGDPAGPGDIMQSARSILPYPALYALAAGVTVYFASGLLPVLLGSDFSTASDVLRWLAWLPLVSLPRRLLQLVLSSSDRQQEALKVIAFGAVTNIVLNLWLIPAHGWKGAVLATYLAEALMLVVMLSGWNAMKRS